MFVTNMLHIVCGEEFTIVNAERARSLELKLNVTSKGRAWKHIGDCLFAFYAGNVVTEELSVSPEQYIFLKRVAELTLDECRKL